jgi:CRP/FNR family cyclic AMP-dependent transcriptional regulator
MIDLKDMLQNKLFDRMSPQHLDMTRKQADEATFSPGQFLFKENEPANRLFVIERGRVAIEAHEPANGTVLVETVGPGEVVGWSWLFPPFTWHFQARAVEPTKALVVDGANLLILAERDHTFGYELMKRVAQLVIHRLEATRKKLLETDAELTP